MLLSFGTFSNPGSGSVTTTPGAVGVGDSSSGFGQGSITGADPFGGTGATEPSPELALATTSGFTGPVAEAFTIVVAQGTALTNASLILTSQNASALIDVTVVTPATANGITAPVTSTGNAVGTAFDFTGTPTAVATNVFDITITDGTVTTVWQVTFDVQASSAPVITSTAPTTVASPAVYTYTIVATGAPSPTFSITGAPAWLTLTGNVLSGTPSADGTYGPMTITATNGVALDDTEIFSIVATGYNAAPVITSTAPTAVANPAVYTYTIIATGAPAATFSVSGAPAWLTLTGNVLSGTPTADGTFGPITITATNGIAPDDTEVFSIVASGGYTTTTTITGGGGGGSGCALSNNSSVHLLFVVLGVLGFVAVLRRRRHAQI